MYLAIRCSSSTVSNDALSASPSRRCLGHRRVHRLLHRLVDRAVTVPGFRPARIAGRAGWAHCLLSGSVARPLALAPGTTSTHRPWPLARGAWSRLALVLSHTDPRPHARPISRPLILHLVACDRSRALQVIQRDQRKAPEVPLEQIPRLALLAVPPDGRWRLPLQVLVVQHLEPVDPRDHPARLPLPIALVTVVPRPSLHACQHHQRHQAHVTHLALIDRRPGQAHRVVQYPHVVGREGELITQVGCHLPHHQISFLGPARQARVQGHVLNRLRPVQVRAHPDAGHARRRSSCAGLPPGCRSPSGPGGLSPTWPGPRAPRRR